MLRTALLAGRWLLRGLARLSVFAARALRRLVEWTAAKPIRAVDLSVASAMVIALAWPLAPRPSEQLAVVTPEPESDTALTCLALNVYHEARGEPQDGQLAVAKVVMNRVRDPRFPDDVCGVVKEGGTRAPGGCQFSWWCDGLSDRPRETAAWEQSLRLAEAVLAGKFGDPTGGALWYHADHVEPGWQMAIVKGPKIGRHIFYASATE